MNRIAAHGDRLGNRDTAMTKAANSQTQKTINFIVGAALLVMLFPHGGKLPEKPAGVRTAIETVSKKPALKTANFAMSIIG